MSHNAIVAAARNEAYTSTSVGMALLHLLDNLTPPLTSLVKRGDRVLVKVNMGCSGARAPEDRHTTHPIFVESIINALLDCGASVSFGDDVSRAGKHSEAIYRATGMSDVAVRTGAPLVDFVAAGAREVPSRLLYPRKYLVSNAYFDTDVVINAANCRSHVGIGLSGAMKNMFGCVVGLRKQRIHNLFPGDPRRFGRAIADIHSVVHADLSFLDLTTVAEGAGIEFTVRPVGIMIAGTDAVALDTVAAHAIGYESLPMWVAYYGNQFGSGCNSIDHISIRGLDWSSFSKARLIHPYIPPITKQSALERVTTVINNTALRPRPVIAAARCTGCGDCAKRCPVECIKPGAVDAYQIDLKTCVDCGCCLKVCEAGAVTTEFVGLARAIRLLTNRLPESLDLKSPNPLDPAAKN